MRTSNTRMPLAAEAEAEAEVGRFSRGRRMRAIRAVLTGARSSAISAINLIKDRRRLLDDEPVSTTLHADWALEENNTKSQLDH
ncbi:unnamed protein product, partial [Iphiclides podalirius]